MTDVVVVCVDPNSVEIPDLGLTITPGAQYTIPSGKANESKDLWAALGARRLFRIVHVQKFHSLPVGGDMAKPGEDLTPVVHELRKRVKELEQEVYARDLEIAALRQVQVPGMDEVVAMLRASVGDGLRIPQGATSRGGSVQDVPTPTRRTEEPVFVPEVTPVAHQETSHVSEEASEAGDAAEARRLLKAAKAKNKLAWSIVLLNDRQGTTTPFEELSPWI